MGLYGRDGTCRFTEILTHDTWPFKPKINTINFETYSNFLRSLLLEYGALVLFHVTDSCLLLLSSVSKLSILYERIIDGLSMKGT